MRTARRGAVAAYLLLACLAAAAAGATAAAAAALEQERLPYLPRSVLVRYASGAASRGRRLAAASEGLPPGLAFGRLLHRGGQAAGQAADRRWLAAGIDGGATPLAGRLAELIITDGSSVPDRVEELRKRPEFDHVQPNYLYRTDAAWRGAGAPLGARRLLAGGTVTPNDPLSTSGDEWHLTKIGMPTAWATTTGSDQVGVCVIDTGIRKTHEDLAANFAGGWNRGCTVCDGSDTPTPGTTAYSDLTDTDGHGTLVSGAVAAVGNNTKGVAGIMWKAKIWACKASVNDNNPAKADELSGSAVQECMELCRETPGVRVVVAAFGNTEYDPIQAWAIGAMRDANILVVASAGNYGTNNTEIPIYPAGLDYPNVLAVAATTEGDELTEFSNFGGTVQLASPGQFIWTTGKNNNSAYEQDSGTSVSGPLVAGVAGLLWSARPAASYAAIKKAILDSVTPIASLNGYVKTGGRLNAAGAIAALTATAAPPPSPPSPIAWYTYERGSAWVINRYLDTQMQVLNASADPSDWRSCAESCVGTSWCHIFQHAPYILEWIPPFLNETGQEVTYPTGSCVLYDSSASKNVELSEDLASTFVVKQSTTSGSATAAKAFDGNAATFSSTTSSAKPWWSLDMKASRRVVSVTITAVNAATFNQLKDVEVRVGNALPSATAAVDKINAVCLSKTGQLVTAKGKAATLTCSGGAKSGRYLTIHIKTTGTTKATLSLAEVTVKLQ